MRIDILRLYVGIKIENKYRNVFISKLKAINLLGDSIIYLCFTLVLPIKYFSLIFRYYIISQILLLIRLFNIPLISFSQYACNLIEQIKIEKQLIPNF